MGYDVESSAYYFHVKKNVSWDNFLFTLSITFNNKVSYHTLPSAIFSSFLNISKYEKLRLPENIFHVTLGTVR